MNEKPSYYAIIPADVRYAKIPGDAKLLYGELTALSNKEGFCWASNKYFSDLYDVQDGTIRNWLNALKENDFIRVEIEQGYKRKIFIVGGVKKLTGGSAKKEPGAVEKLSASNNTPNNQGDDKFVTPSVAGSDLEKVIYDRIGWKRRLSNLEFQKIFNLEKRCVEAGKREIFWSSLDELHSGLNRIPEYLEKVIDGKLNGQTTVDSSARRSSPGTRQVFTHDDVLKAAGVDTKENRRVES